MPIFESSDSGAQCYESGRQASRLIVTATLFEHRSSSLFVVQFHVNVESPTSLISHKPVVLIAVQVAITKAGDENSEA